MPQSYSRAAEGCWHDAGMDAQEVAPGVHRIHSHDVVNWYLVEDEGRLAMIDAGLPPDWETLERTARSLGRSTSDLAAVVLTHAHVDHTGIAEQARVDAGATVYLPDGERELAAHQLRASKSERNPVAYLRYPATRSLYMTMMRSGALRSRPIRAFQTYDDGDVLDAVPGRPVAVGTPGHTLGHTSLHLPDRDVLFTGDALVTRNPYTGETGPRLVSLAATADSQQALRSLDRIAETGATTLLPGHGDPWNDGASEAASLARAAGNS
jgi:glyoxylase-like metal-dependent hydrolase (beta-lactamase superfamily II)